MKSGRQLVVYPTKDVDGAKKIFSTLLGTDPYVDGEYYVGFRAGGLEVGLDPNGTGGESTKEGHLLNALRCSRCPS